MLKRPSSRARPRGAGMKAVGKRNLFLLTDGALACETIALALFERQVDDKRRAGARSTLQLNGPTVGLYCMLYDREPKTAPPGISRSVLVNTVKTLKKMWLIAEWHTRPVVVDCYDRFATVGANFDQYADARLAPVFKRIVDQIKEHLFDAESVRFHPRWMLGHTELYLRRDLVNARIQAVNYPLNAFPQVDPFKIQARFSRASRSPK